MSYLSVLNRSLGIKAKWGILLTAILCIGLAGCGNDSTTSPSPETTTVAQILANPGNFTNVVLEGQNIRTTSDNDELVFTDGTGEIVADYQSGNVPPLNTRIRIFGTVASSEIDVSSWEAL